MLIYTPKEAHSRVFVTGGSCFARQMVAKTNLGAASFCGLDQHSALDSGRKKNFFLAMLKQNNGKNQDISF